MERSVGRSSQENSETNNDLRTDALEETRNKLCETVLSSKSDDDITASLKKKYEDIPALTLNEYELKLELEANEAFLEKARKELRETPEIVKESLAAIREMLKEDPNLYIPDSDEFLKKFLRPCKWYPKSAFHLLQRCYRYRANYPTIVKNLTPMSLKNVFCADILMPLPKRCPNGCRVLAIHGGYKWKPKEVCLDDILRGIMVILEAALSESTTQIAGVQTIIDLEGFSLSQVTYFTPRFASAVTEWVQRCLPCRLKSIHIVNQPFIFNMVFTIFKPFLMEKFRKRIYFHGTNRQNLLASIGAEALPKKYGGELNLLDNSMGDKLWKYFCNFEEEYEDRLKHGYIHKE